ncbi:hypothetical protein ACOMHN_025467 [Nucella lapillus]
MSCELDDHVQRQRVVPPTQTRNGSNTQRVTDPNREWQQHTTGHRPKPGMAATPNGSPTQTGNGSSTPTGHRPKPGMTATPQRVTDPNREWWQHLIGVVPD